MSGWFKFICVLYWLAMIFWIGAIITVAIAAMNTFGTLPAPGMGVQLELFSSYPTEHHGRLAAGMVMEKNFFVADAIQMFAIPVVILTLFLQLFTFHMSIRKPANIVRAVCLVGAALAFGWYGLTIAPGMNRELRTYWEEAKAGNVEQAEIHRAAFEVDHPRAERVLQINLILVLIGAGASAWAFASFHVTKPPAGSFPKYETPRLAKDS
ncbi:MAG: hypothetical protein O7G85_08350 [Planctomycetota bacterium]|nr:hypothetical protein [Planctomycetota bacterium]